MNGQGGRLAGIAERRVFKAYSSLSSVPTDELQALANLLRSNSSGPGPNQTGFVGPVVMAELARRRGAGCSGPSEQ